MYKVDNILEVLILKSNSILGSGCLAICEAIQVNTTIKSLDLSENCIGDEGGMALASLLQVNSVLANLFVSSCGFGASSTISLATVLQTNNAIQQLDFSNNSLSTASLSHSLLRDTMTHLSTAIRVNTGIRIIVLSKLAINDYVIVHLLGPALKNNRTIESLNLSRQVKGILNGVF
jgi:Ran GTPase-activating protein (RanGAP) involved in mRNA processing and transport